MSNIESTALYIPDGNTLVIWVDGADGIDDIEGPTVQELEGGVDLSMEVTSGGFIPNITEGMVEGGVVGSGNISQAIGRTAVAPTIDFWRRRPPGDVAWDLFRKGDVGWLAWRSGYAEGTQIDDGQEWSIGLFEVGTPQPSFPGGETNQSFTLNFALVRGDMFNLNAIVGGES